MMKIKKVRFRDAVLAPRNLASTYIEAAKDVELFFDQGFVHIKEPMRTLLVPMNGNVCFFEPLEETKTVAVAKKGTKDGKANQEVA